MDTVKCVIKYSLLVPFCVFLGVLVIAFLVPFAILDAIVTLFSPSGGPRWGKGYSGDVDQR
jgi:hypothetical protein